MLPGNLDQYLVDLYRGWDAVERVQHKNTVLDFDLAAPRRFPPLHDRNEVRQKLEAVSSDLEGEKSSLGVLARARIRASITYLRALGGEPINFRPYLRQTLGVEPRMFSDEEIRTQRGLAAERLWQHYEMRFSSDERIRFQSKMMFYNTNHLPKEFERFRAKWIPHLLERIPVPLEKYNIKVRFASEDAYWKNWISGNLSEHEILLRINIHPRQFWYHGFPELLVIHEYCGHAVQMINWHRRIESEELSEFFGILTVHFPDQFLLEGLAESLAFVLPEQQKLQAESLVSRELHRYYLLVMNNVHILANEQTPQIALDYAIRNLPFTPRDVLEREVRDRTQNPLFRIYQYAYGIAKETFLRALSRFKAEARWQLLGLVYNRPMNAIQFERAADKLAVELAGSS